MTKPFYIDWSKQPSETAVWCEGIGLAMKKYSGWHEIDYNGNFVPVCPPSGNFAPWLWAGKGHSFEVFEKPEAKMVQIDWTKAPAGSEAARVCFDDYVEFYKTVDNVFCFWSENEQQWIAAFTDRNSEKLVWKKSWHESGELPPVGERVLMVHEDASDYCIDAARWSAHSGKEVTIVAHSSVDGRGVTPIAVYEVDHNGVFEYHAMVASCFKPLPTEEEKAAAAKEAFIEEAHAVCLDGGSWGLQNMLGRLYDAGYRKQEDAQ